MRGRHWRSDNDEENEGGRRKLSGRMERTTNEAVRTTIRRKSNTMVRNTDQNEK